MLDCVIVALTLIDFFILKPKLQPCFQVRAFDSPLFRHLNTLWSFTPGPVPTSCWLNFEVDFDFRSTAHMLAVDLFFVQVILISFL